MYQFRDVMEITEGVSLPSEALKINGEFIENQITGYRTLTVEGREALSPEVSTYETGLRDGSTMKGKRYPARTIRVTYQLIANTNEEFREAYNKLASILNVTDAELIFNDETDKYFIGTPALIGEVTPGRNCVVGEFEILCLDPFKYSVMEYEAKPADGDTSILIDYHGTYKSFPTLHAEFYQEDEASEDGETETPLTGNGDCGYVAFFNEDKKIIQIGDPGEADGENLASSQTLLNQTYDKSSSWGTAAKSLWGLNRSKITANDVAQTGNVKMGVARYTTPVTTTGSQTLLYTTSEVDRPYFIYDVCATVKNRTINSVEVAFVIKTTLKNTSSYYGTGLSLDYALRLGDVDYSFSGWLKKKDDYWRGIEWHTKTITKKVPVSQSTTKIGNITFTVTPDSSLGQAGTLSEVKCKDLSIPAYIAPEPVEYNLCPSDYGTGSKWHGPSITRTLPADAAGEVGATNFSLSYTQKMSIGTGSIVSGQLGAFHVFVVSGSGSSGKIIAGANIYKLNSGNSVSLRFYVNGAVKETITIKTNNMTFDSPKTSTITKYGSKISFNIFGITKSYNVAALATTAATEVTFAFLQYGKNPALEFNGLKWVKFVKNNCDTWKDVKNKFSANDVLEADCKTGAILLNENDTPALGALGNDWEEFCLTPGINQIGFAYSEWVGPAYAPAIKVKYREVFL